ncbi:MAG: low-specificity L-threonine aldolase [Phycisphaerae bacterium]|nr:low-specificity L-threonine aldolase [Fodinibius sp.]NIU57840.1 low-specificity L-threonine aldolase [Phycisphaerae bacterium]NIV12480.1 low-specificity L-threonine aldolase [Fodinibius sp.]NIW94278.1 low-specificity L-threonine aldolase [Phycisphaerae bacterium]NIY26168.1 low-specificity L-threonine aldolase [Fodinibius sp.]
MKSIDLRSDTVTLPTSEMREAIYQAELGDDVFGEDPTINRFEKMAAERVGKEAALFVASGTMGNLVCSLTHCARGEEVILGDKSHMFLNEAGGMSTLGGIHPHIVANQPDGTIRLEDIEGAIRGSNVHYPRTRLICLENTHNSCNGAALPAVYIESVSALAKRHGLLLHLDGARIFNAAVALEVDVKELTRNVDSVSFCLSKGLSAPVGSVVCGSSEFIAEARRSRKVLGGGMRQAGIIAAAGIVAVERMVERLKEDHANVRRLAEGIDKIEGLSIDLAVVQTNIIYFELVSEKVDVQTFLTQLGEKGIKLLRLGGPRRFRVVTHYGIEAEDIEISLKAMREVLEES